MGAFQPWNPHRTRTEEPAMGCSARFKQLKCAIGMMRAASLEVNMTVSTRVRRRCLVAALVALGALAGAPAEAQTTTGSIAGTVMDQRGGLLPGASIEAVHLPTGTTYRSVTQAD